MSATILQFVKETSSFDPEVTRIMVQAFDQACAVTVQLGQTSVVQEVIAKRIVDIANSGERDPGRLCTRALESLGLPMSERLTG